MTETPAATTDSQHKSGQSSRAMTPKSEGSLHLHERHPYITGAIMGAPIAALYGAFHKPINKFACNLINYIGRANKNAFSAFRNTPFHTDQTQSNDQSSKTKATPNPTPKVSSGNSKYDEQHKNTINGKDY